MIHVLICFALALFFGAIALIGFVAHFCFDDADPDLNFYDNYSVIDCPHLEQTDIVEECFASYELVASYCTACGQRVSSRQDGF